MASSNLYQAPLIGDILKELEELNKSAQEVNLREGADLKLIEKFEKTLGRKLPPDYKKFLEFTNGAIIDGIDFCKIPEANIIKPEDSLIEMAYYLNSPEERTRTYRSLYKICDDGADDILINLQPPRRGSDPKRADILDVHANIYRTEVKVIAKNFGEFLYRILESRRGTKDGEDSKARYWLKRGFKSYREYLGPEFPELLKSFAPA